MGGSVHRRGYRRLRLAAPLCIAQLCFVAMLAGKPALTSGQTLTGVVVHLDSTSPAQGVLVEVRTRRSGSPRTLTDARGAFRVRLPQSDSARVRVLRIGFRPYESPPLFVSDSLAQPLLLVLDATPYAMSVVTASAKSRCGERADDEGWRRWEQALTVLHSVNLAQHDTGLKVVAVEYDGETTEAGVTAIRADSLKLLTNPPPLPAAHYDAIFERVFVRRNPGDTAMYSYAPDARPLADDRFVPGYCFRSWERTPNASELLGVAFEPVFRRRTTDIEGTLWRSRDSLVLRRIDFTYVQLPREHNIRGPGGYAEFAQLPTGHWIVSDWMIRMAQRVISLGRCNRDINDVYVGYELSTGCARMSTSKYGLWARGQVVANVKRGDERLYVDPEAQLLARRAAAIAKRPE